MQAIGNASKIQRVPARHPHSAHPPSHTGNLLSQKFRTRSAGLGKWPQGCSVRRKPHTPSAVMQACQAQARAAQRCGAFGRSTQPKAAPTPAPTPVAAEYPDQLAFVRHFRTASPYIAGHRGCTFVIVIPGQVLQNAEMLVRACRPLPRNTQTSSSRCLDCLHTLQIRTPLPVFVCIIAGCLAITVPLHLSLKCRV